VRLSRAVDLLFLAAVFTATFTQVERAEVGLKLFDVLGLLFVAALVAERLATRDVKLRSPEAALLVAAGALLVVYLAGAAGLETHWSRVQFAKGLGRFLVHFAVLIAAVSYLGRRPARCYWRALAALCAGIGVNAAYGAAQLVAAKAGLNLDGVVLEPLTGRPARTLEYAFSFGPRVERPRGLTTDPNHLGVMLLVPVLVLLPLSFRGQSRRSRRSLPFVLAFLLLVEAATLSRSAAVGLAAGLAVLAWRYRRALLSRQLLTAGAAVAACLALLVAHDAGFYGRVFSARVDLRSHGQPSHLQVYEFIPPALESNALVGVGLNNFAPFSYPVTGRRDYGPLSLYVQLLVETGLVGMVVFIAFLGYCALRLRTAHGLAARRSLEEPWFDALVWGLAAVFVGTMVANAFYLTMTFAYFYVFLALVVMASVALGNSLELREGVREELRVAPRGVLAGDVVPAAPAHRE
jgi:O-Antigen ligase